MKVELIDHTRDALELLILTKGTRLQSDNNMNSIRGWSDQKKLEELSYMRDTIKSSWEFVNYTFKISEVSRAFTHQFVRTRTGRYAQESMRTIDARKNGWLEIRDEEPRTRLIYDCAMLDSFAAYSELVDMGTPAQEARNVLPTGALTSIIAQFSLRTLHEMATTRLCVRTQGEYQDVFRAMKSAVVAVHPWAESFIRVGCAQNGICVFPRYKDCPIQSLTFNALPRYKATIDAIAAAADTVRHEATPVAKNGRTM